MPSGLVHTGVLLLVLLLPVHALKVHVFTNATDPDFVYPELNAKSQFVIDSLLLKPSLGVALSGGGWRAAALAYGWLRAMHLMNITDSAAQYISANSAGTWAAVPYAFTTAPMNRFFSPYYEPNNLTVSRLSASLTPGSWGQYAAGRTLLAGAVGNPVKEQGAPSNWANNIASIFLAPFDLGSSDASISADGTRGDLLQQTKNRLASKKSLVYAACSGTRPYPIITAAVMTPERSVSPRFFPFEFTPLYVGMPPVADYTKPTAIGGGFVEPLGFNSLAPRRKVVSKDGEEAVDVTPANPSTTSSLAHFVGISSSSPALLMQPTNRLTARLFNGQMVNYWNLWDYKQHELSFLDGGAVDDLAIMPLLRRGVRNIIACVATHTEPVSVEQFAAGEYALAGLFSALPLDAKSERGQPLKVHGVDDVMGWNEMQHVFPTDGFEDLFLAFKASSDAGEAAVFSRSYEVLPNSFMGVSGGYQVNVLWVLNSRALDWEQALPETTLRWLDQQRTTQKGPYKDYPNVHNVMEAPGPLISLLSQQASWMFRSKKEMILGFVTASAGSVSGPGEEVLHGTQWK